MNALRISDILGRGQTEALPLRHLVEVTGWDGRTVRRMIERERRQGIPILCDNKAGYFLPADEDEVTVCVKSLRKRAGEIMKTATAIERVTLANEDGQIGMWDGGGRGD